VVVVLGQTFREEWERLLATLVGLLGDFDLVEEAAQEALVIPAKRRAADG
jgi:RNA polymerase sigma-70 factor (ECF subfamily)